MTCCHQKSLRRYWNFSPLLRNAKHNLFVEDGKKSSVTATFWKKPQVNSFLNPHIWCFTGLTKVFSSAERISCMFISGNVTTEVLTGDFETKNFPKLPARIESPTIVMHNGTILLCGGRHNEEKCLQVDHGTWKEHSTLNKKRTLHSAVTTQTATFIFGGIYSRKTYEYLPKDSTKWLMGKT